jgi:hypothetical protein
VIRHALRNPELAARPPQIQGERRRGLAGNTTTGSDVTSLAERGLI